MAIDTFLLSSGKLVKVKDGAEPGVEEFMKAHRPSAFPKT
jgi:hypothetical protein